MTSASKISLQREVYNERETEITLFNEATSGEEVITF
jgi:hypothetical protein